MTPGKGIPDSARFFHKCRTCLDESDYVHPITAMAVMEDSREITYGDLLTEIVQINIKDDNLRVIPQYICDCCSQKLKSSHAFIKKAREANNQLCTLSLLHIESIQKSDCLQESEIDIQTCLEIKMEGVDNAEENGADMASDSVVKFKAEMNDEISLAEQIDSTKKADDIEDRLISYHASNDDSDSSLEIVVKTSQSETSIKKRSNTYSDRPTKGKGKLAREKVRADKCTDYEKEDADIAVPCLQCNKIFNNSKELLRHLRNTHLPEDQKCACPICGVKFTRSCNMYKHMRKLHDSEAVKNLLPSKEKPFECDRCKRRYTQKRQLNCHIKEKHDKEKDEKADKDLSKSEKKKQPEIRPLCFVCGSSFSNKAHLIVHMTRHTGEKPFRCDLCDRAFPRISDLTIHRRIHTGEKPFKCKQCDKAFRVSTKLANHMRSHTNERPYKCKQCERSFKYSKDLNIHMRIHTGERPYCCTVCGSTFTQSNSLKAHRMKLGHMGDIAPQPPFMQLVA